jgi:cell division septal protein FtsQ
VHFIFAIDCLLHLLFLLLLLLLLLVLLLLLLFFLFLLQDWVLNSESHTSRKVFYQVLELTSNHFFVFRYF